MNAYGIIRTLGVVVLLSGASVQCFKKEFTSYGKEIDSYVNPADGKLIGVNTPVWIAFTNADGTIQHKRMEEGYVGKVVNRFYTSNPDIFSVRLDRRKRDNPSFDEIVSGLHIRSLPNHFQKRSTSVKEQDKIRRLERQIREASRSDNRTHRSTMEYIYPSLLVQTDMAGLLEPEVISFDDDIIYQIAFWNGVDLLFRKISEPKIRIRIAGLIIGVERAATPYLRKNVPGNRVIEMGKYWYNMSQHADFPLSAYHIVVTMTDTDQLGTDVIVTSGPSLCEPPHNGSFGSRGIFIADVRFGGTPLAVWLLGNILGVFEGDLIGAECQMPEDFLLKTLKGESQEWSSCARDRFSNLARKGYLDCYAQPAEFYPPGDAIRRVLPGDFVSAEDQCQSRGYNTACEESSDTCSQLQCYFTGWHGYLNGMQCRNKGLPAEGTVCGPGRKCVNGSCRCMSAHCLYRPN